MQIILKRYLLVRIIITLTYVFTEGHLPNLALQVDASHKWVRYHGIKTVSVDESLYPGTTIRLIRFLSP